MRSKTYLFPAESERLISSWCVTRRDRNMLRSSRSSTMIPAGLADISGKPRPPCCDYASRASAGNRSIQPAVFGLGGSTPRFIFLQQSPLDLSARRTGQAGGKLNHTRNLIGGHALAGPRHNFLFRRVLAVPKHDHRLYRLASTRIVSRNDARLLNGRMLEQHCLDLGRPDFVARCIDHALEPVDDEEIPVPIYVAEVSRAQVSLPIDQNKYIQRRL